MRPSTRRLGTGKTEGRWRVMSKTPDPAEMSSGTALQWFPLIRVMSRATTPRLAALNMSPNQATTLGLIAGLAAAACIALGEQLLGAGLFFLYYLFDYCDGELARLHSLSSRFGAYYDDFVDWIVHATFFLALGYQTTVEAGMVVWVWLGAAAAFGSTISAALPLVLGGVPEGEAQIATLSDLGKGARPIDVVIFAFRGLARADFWLIVLGLAIAGWLWVLLPAAAVGSQVFWLLYFKKSVRRILT